MGKLTTRKVKNLKVNDSIKIKGRFQRIHEIKSFGNKSTFIYGRIEDEKAETFLNDEIFTIRLDRNN